MKRWSIVALDIYVLLVASHWALRDGYGRIIPENETQVLVFSFVVAGAGASGLEWGSVPRLRGLRTLCAGLLLFGLPSVLWAVPGATLPVLTRVSILALVPAVLVLIDSVRNSGGVQFLSLLGASLAGVAGCLLFLPVDLAALLQKPTAAATVLAATASIAAGSYLGYEETRAMPLRLAIVLLAAPNAVMTLAIVAVTHASMKVPSWGDFVGVLWGAAELLLLVYLIRVLSPIALGARFLMVPLVTAVEGFLLVRPSVTVRLLAGASLLSIGTVLLLRVGDSKARDSSLSLL